MKFKQASDAIEIFAKSLPNFFSNVKIEHFFGDKSAPVGDWSNPDNMGVLVEGDGIGSKSGVYFFGDPDGNIIYIGKATKNNLHHRVWDHLKTPVDMPDRKKIFPKHKFGSCFSAPEQVAHIQSGRAKLALATVSDPSLASLLEVYLLTLHLKENLSLPALNKQIG